MPVRTFVSFKAQFPKTSDPPGKELAEFVSAALTSASISHEAPTEREEWGWTIYAQRRHVKLEIIVGLSDDGPREWQIHTYQHLPFLGRILNRSRLRTESENALTLFCETLDKALKADSRFNTIRWYYHEVFEKDFGETWGDAP